MGLVGEGVVHGYTISGHLLKGLLGAVEEPASGPRAHSPLIVSARTCREGADVGRQMDKSTVRTMAVVSKETKANYRLLTAVLLLVVVI